MSYYGAPFDAPSKEGVHAILMPPTSRRVELRVFYVPRSSAIRRADGTVETTPWLELAPMDWRPMLIEGEWSGEPFAKGIWEDDKSPRAVLQAMVDLGHKLGLVPTNAPDRSAEITALGYHLEDMRILAGIKAKS